MFPQENNPIVSELKALRESFLKFSTEFSQLSLPGQPVQFNDTLKVIILNADAQDTFSIQYILKRRSDGELVVGTYPLICASGVPTEGDWPLIEGTLLGLLINPSGNVIHQIGRVHVYADIVRGGTFNGGVFSGGVGWRVLIHDYLSKEANPTWPPVPRGMNPNAIAPIVIAVADPAAGAVKDYALPDHTLLQIESIKFQFATSAVAGNRRVRIEVRDSAGHNTQYFCAETDQAASLTRVYFFCRGVTKENIDTAATKGYTEPLGEVTLVSAETIRISVIGIDAADQISSIYIRAKWMTIVT